MLHTLPADLQRRILAQLPVPDRIRVSIASPELARVDREDTAAWNQLAARDFAGQLATTKEGKARYADNHLRKRLRALESDLGQQRDTLVDAENHLQRTDGMAQRAVRDRLTEVWGPVVGIVPAAIGYLGFEAYQVGKSIGAACHHDGRTGKLGLAIGGVMGVTAAVAGAAGGLVMGAGFALAAPVRAPLLVVEERRKARRYIGEVQQKVEVARRAHDGTRDAIQRLAHMRGADAPTDVGASPPAG